MNWKLLGVGLGHVLLQQVVGLVVWRGEVKSNEASRDIVTLYKVLWTEGEDKFDRHLAERQSQPERMINIRSSNQQLPFFYHANI
jgi:hypothetical protein